MNEFSQVEVILIILVNNPTAVNNYTYRPFLINLPKTSVNASFWSSSLCVLLCQWVHESAGNLSLDPNFSMSGLFTNLILVVTHRDTETNEITYSRMENEAIIINTQAAALAGLGILLPIMLALHSFRRRWNERLTEHL